MVVTVFAHRGLRRKSNQKLQKRTSCFVLPTSYPYICIFGNPQKIRERKETGKLSCIRLLYSGDFCHLWVVEQLVSLSSGENQEKENLAPLLSVDTLNR